MFELTESEKMILDTVKKISVKEIKPNASYLDEQGGFPWHSHKVFTKIGLMSTLIPEKYGGIGLRYLVFCMVLEEIAKVCASSALLLIAQADGTLPIIYRASEELKEEVLPRLCEGAIAAFAATEPNAGSDILSMRTKATRTNGNYTVNGQKCFITNGSVADYISLFAYTDPEKRAKGITGFVVKKGSCGLYYGKNENKMGMRGSVNSELIFENMIIPESCRLGEEGEGFGLMMRALDCSRLFCASQAVGIAQGAIEEALSYSKHRIQFGKPISEIQAIQFMFADMVAYTEAARLLTYKAAIKLDRAETKEATRFCAMAKFLASDTAMKVTTDAVQIMGGYGYMKDFPVERMMRDAKLTQIYTGTNQIMRVVAGREITKI